MAKTTANKATKAPAKKAAAKPAAEKKPAAKAVKPAAKKAAPKAAAKPAAAPKAAPKAAAAKKVAVEFVADCPLATTVSVAGSFNNWAVDRQELGRRRQQDQARLIARFCSFIGRLRVTGAFFLQITYIHGI